MRLDWPFDRRYNRNRQIIVK